MDLPSISAGMKLLAEQINKITREVRSNAITAVTGGTFQRTTGGTSIQVQPATGNAAAYKPNCYFEITDASTDQGLRIQISQHLLVPLLRWPEGMGKDYPPYRMDISQSSYVYMAFVYDPETLELLPDSSAITIELDDQLKANTENTFYYFLGLVTIEQVANETKITAIQNSCNMPQPNPCYLQWTSSSGGGGG